MIFSIMKKDPTVEYDSNTKGLKMTVTGQFLQRLFGISDEVDLVGVSANQTRGMISLYFSGDPGSYIASRPTVSPVEVVIIPEGQEWYEIALEYREDDPICELMNWQGVPIEEFNEKYEIDD